MTVEHQVNAIVIEQRLKNGTEPLVYFPLIRVASHKKTSEQGRRQVCEHGKVFNALRTKPTWNTGAREC